MKTIKTTHGILEVVTEVPPGYSVWPVGSNWQEKGYIPIAAFDAKRLMVKGTLKALKCEGAEVIMKSPNLAKGTVKSFERYIEKYQDRRPKECYLMSAALPYMRKIKGL